MPTVPRAISRRRRRICTRRRPIVVAIGGLPGSGKSTLARALAPEIGSAPGALVLRSDEIRKRQHGVAPEQRLPQAAYSDAASEAVFGDLAALVERDRAWRACGGCGRDLHRSAPPGDARGGGAIRGCAVPRHVAGSAVACAGGTHRCARARCVRRDRRRVARCERARAGTRQLARDRCRRGCDRAGPGVRSDRFIGVTGHRRKHGRRQSRHRFQSGLPG